MKKIAFGCDHRGFEVKSLIFDYLAKKGYEVLDCGTDSADSTDYTDHTIEAAEKLSKGECELAIAVCFTGIGSSIAANKVEGVRASLVSDVERAKLTRAHNDSNMLILGSGFMKEEEVIPVIDAWLSTDFEGGRHARRVDKIKAYEAKKSKEG